MKLHDPFIISSALAPAIKIGDTTLSLLEVEQDGDRVLAMFELRGPDIDYADETIGMSGPDIDYVDDTLRSGVQGWKSVVEIFETYLSLLDAAAEAMAYPHSDNRDLFPDHVMQWCADHSTEIAMARCEICDEDGNPLHHLIEE